jgi:hypothetical protein
MITSSKELKLNSVRSSPRKIATIFSGKGGTTFD